MAGVAQTDANCDVLSSNYLRTCNARKRMIGQYLLALWQRRGLACQRLLHVCFNCILYTQALWPACVETGACNVHLLHLMHQLHT